MDNYDPQPPNEQSSAERISLLPGKRPPRSWPIDGTPVLPATQDAQPHRMPQNGSAGVENERHRQSTPSLMPPKRHTVTDAQKPEIPQIGFVADKSGPTDPARPMAFDRTSPIDPDRLGSDRTVTSITPPIRPRIEPSRVEKKDGIMNQPTSPIHPPEPVHFSGLQHQHAESFSFPEKGITEREVFTSFVHG